VVGSSILQLYKRSSFIFLVPLLIFNGFEQGFVYSDYTKVCIAGYCGFERTKFKKKIKKIICFVNVCFVNSITQYIFATIFNLHALKI